MAWRDGGSPAVSPDLPAAPELAEGVLVQPLLQVAAIQALISDEQLKPGRFLVLSRQSEDVAIIVPSESVVSITLAKQYNSISDGRGGMKRGEPLP